MALTLTLTKYRALANLGLPDTAAIQRVAAATDSAGGRTRAWATVSGMDAVPCRYTQLQITPREVEGTNQVQTLSYWRFTFAAETDVRSTDRIVAGGRTFEVVQGGGHSYEVARTVTALEVV